MTKNSQASEDEDRRRGVSMRLQISELTDLLTRDAVGHNANDKPSDGLEEIIRARHETKPVPVRDTAFSCSCRSKTAQGQVGREVGQLAELHRQQ